VKKIVLLFALQFAICNLQFTIAQKLEPTEKDALLTVSVINEKNKPQAGEQVIFESFKTKKTFSGITKDDGKFDLLVPKGDKYKVKYKAFTSEADYTVLEVPDKKGELLSFEITIQFELPKQYTLDNVYFDFGKATLREESYKELDELVEYMKLKKSLVIEIAGHTDNVGSADANLKLSQSRAESVRDYLIKKGITPSRVLAKGYGDTQPIASNDTEEGRQKNRRTEVRVIK
jgi:outer membrane protein OmpA-like peptidoglycan-associated protein